jgi:hypothetical protein
MFRGEIIPMSDDQPSELPERNPVTHRSHRKQVFWQITVPLIIGVVILLALGFLTAWRTAPEPVRRWADVSLIWLILPMLVMLLLGTVIVGALAFVVIKIIQKLPAAMLRVQSAIASVGAAVRKLGDKLAGPFIRIRSLLAALDTLKRK